MLRNMSAHQTRASQIEDPYDHTFEWIWDPTSANNFMEWLDQKCGIYWIRGKPGSGKSTIMKHILARYLDEKFTLPRPKHLINASFFFHDRGSADQKSLFGLLCSILCQILSQQKNFYKDASPFLWDSTLSTTKHVTIDDLRSALLAITLSTEVEANLFLFIDAVDELDGDAKKYHDVAEFFCSLARSSSGKVNTKVLIASRNLNPLHDVLDDYQGLVMDEWTGLDIDTYVRGKLESHPVVARSEFHKAACQGLIHTVVESARGVFLWVRLVVEQLEEGLSNGETVEELAVVLASLPQDLEMLYVRILERIKPIYFFEAFVMIQVVACATEPLSLEDFWFVMQHALKVQGQMTLAGLQRRLKSRCGGLIEIRLPYDIDQLTDPPSTKYLWSTIYDTTGEVLFLHQTAKEFVDDPNRLRVLFEQQSECFENGYSWLFGAGVDMMISACDNNPRQQLGYINSTLADRVTTSVAKIMHYARLSEHSLSRSFVTPLVKLNKALERTLFNVWARSFSLSGGLSNYTSVTQTLHFEEWEPDRSWLSIAISTGLRRTASEVIESLIRHKSAIMLHSLLYYAARPSIKRGGFDESSFEETSYFLGLFNVTDVGHHPELSQQKSAIFYLIERLLWCQTSSRLLIYDEKTATFLIALLRDVLGHGGSFNEKILFSPLVHRSWGRDANEDEDYNMTTGGALRAEWKDCSEEEREELDPLGAYKSRRDHENDHFSKDKKLTLLKSDKRQIGTIIKIPRRSKYSDSETADMSSFGNPESFIKTSLSSYRPSFQHSNRLPRATDPWYFPIHVLVRLDNTAVLEFLRDEGADMSIKDSTGNTPLQIAKEFQCPDSVAWLVQWNEDRKDESSTTRSCYSEATQDEKAYTKAGLN